MKPHGENLNIFLGKVISEKLKGQTIKILKKEKCVFSTEILKTSFQKNGFFTFYVTEPFADKIEILLSNLGQKSETQYKVSKGEKQGIWQKDFLLFFKISPLRGLFIFL